MNAGTDTGQRAGRREWIALAVLALPTLLLSLDVSVLYGSPLGSLPSAAK